MIQFLSLISLLTSCRAFAVYGNRWGPPRTIVGASTQHHIATDPQEHVVELEEENKIKTVDILSLESIRSTLIRQEETIIFALIERAQFRHNDVVYKAGGFDGLGLPLGSTLVENNVELSFLEYFLIGTVRQCCLSCCFLFSCSQYRMPTGSTSLRSETLYITRRTCLFS